MVGKGGGARSSSSSRRRRRRSTSSSNNRSNGDSNSNSIGNSHDNGNGIGHSQGPGSNSPAAGPQCPSTIGTPWAADEHMHPGRRCAGFCSGVKKRVSPSGMDVATAAKRTCGTFTAAAAEEKIKRGLILSETLHVDVLHWEVGRQDGQQLPP